jgi:uncharacterized protein YcaQ
VDGAVTPTIPAHDARRLFLGAQGLLDDPASPVAPGSLRRLVERMGFVQIDTINVVERAHHLTLHSRRDRYRPEHLRTLLEKRRSLFEHWTHDASAIPTAWLPYWKPRFARDRERIPLHSWWKHHFRGTDGPQIVRDVKARIVREGALRSSDFEHPEKRGPWWGWKPQKAALDFLWRSGELMVPRREGFQKVYDLTERVFPALAAAPAPSADAHVAWACETAMTRLGLATPKELADFWQAVDARAAAAWCVAETAAGRLVRVVVESADGTAPRSAFAPADWQRRLRRLPDVPDRTRLLCPFDPVLRERARGLRRFGFDYRFEAFVPPPRRRWGYFVMPILEGETIVGRLDPKLHRDRGVLEVRALWWEAGVKPTKARRRRLDEALHRLAAFVGATDVQAP